MIYFLHILTQNVVPMCLLIGTGIALQRLFHLDIKTMSRLLFYLFSPALVFTELYESPISGATFERVLVYFGVFFTGLLIVVELVLRARRLRRGPFKTAMRNSAIFYNSANFGIPLNQLVFHGNPLALSVQIVMMMIQNLLPNTYGVYSINAHRQSWQDSVRTVFRLPAIYAIPLALLLRGLRVPVPMPVMIPLHDLVNGFIAFALTTLGMQLGNMNWSFRHLRLVDVGIASGLRLCVSPALAVLAVRLLAIRGLVGEALILSAAVPTSLVSMLLAVQFDNEPDFASQTVLTSTLLSILTVTAVIYLLPAAI